MASLSTLPLQDYISKNSDLTVSYTTLAAQFGSGYEQTADDGINNKLVTWNVTYSNLDETQSKVVLSFIDLVRGTSVFYATPRGELQQTWRLIPDSLKISHVAVRHTDDELFRTLSFQLNKAYI